MDSTGLLRFGLGLGEVVRCIRHFRTPTAVRPMARSAGMGKSAKKYLPTFRKKAAPKGKLKLSNLVQNRTVSPITPVTLGARRGESQ